MTWVRSLNGVLVLSFLALLTLLLRSYADTAFILPEDFSQLGLGFAAIWILGFTAILGGWIWALISAAKGSRRAVYVLLVYAAVNAIGFGAASLVGYSDQFAEVLVFGSSLLFGALALISGWLYLRDRSYALMPRREAPVNSDRYRATE